MNDCRLEVDVDALSVPLLFLFNAVYLLMIYVTMPEARFIAPHRRIIKQSVEDGVENNDHDLI
jgi:hypothetical protein